jgi:hypothetical protein
MRVSRSTSAFRGLGERFIARASFVAVAAAALCGPSARADLLTNGGFDVAGPLGSAVSNTGTAGPSAADSWNQWAIVPGSTIRTELVPTTDPTGSGKMIHVFTNNGEGPAAPYGNGFAQDFNPVNGADFSYDLYVVSGQVTGGLGSAITGAFVDYPTYGPTGGWIHVTDHWNGPVSAVAFETLTFNAGGAEYYVDNAVVTASVPEPSPLVLAGIGTVLGLCYIGVRRRLIS